MIGAYSSKPSYSKWILFNGTSYTELTVVEVGPGLIYKLIVDSHLPSAILCQIVDILQTIPELCMKISKTFLVLTPFPIKAHQATLHVSLNGNPSPSIGGHVAVDISAAECCPLQLVHSRWS